MSHFSTIKTQLKEAKPLIKALVQLGYAINQEKKFIKGYRGQFTEVDISMDLPGETKVFCTHEYTKSNLDFALVVDDQNDHLKDYSLKVKNLREQNKITLPSSIKKELQINPFLRLDSKNIIFNASKHASISISNEIETLKTIREWKDNF